MIFRNELFKITQRSCYCVWVGLILPNNAGQLFGGILLSGQEAIFQATKPKLSKFQVDF